MKMNEKRRYIEKPVGHHCFGCGTANPVGLNMQFYPCGDMLCSDVVLRGEHVGWENIAHGGIISTLLDEIMSWSIIYFRRVFFVTRKMEVKYVAPVPVGVPLTARGRIVDPTDPRHLKLAGELVDAEGRVLAKSKGDFVELSLERLPGVPEVVKEEMMRLFSIYASTGNARRPAEGAGNG